MASFLYLILYQSFVDLSVEYVQAVFPRLAANFSDQDSPQNCAD